MADVIELRPRDGDGASAGPEDRSDDDLLLLARGGVDGAFDALVRRHQPRALRIAGKYVGPSSAADVVQEAFFDVYRALGRYRPRAKFPSYLHRTVINRCRMWFRRAHRRREEPWALPPELPAPVTEDAVLAEERRKEVERAIATLSRKLREVVVLRFAGELSYPEIADVLGIRTGTVKSRLSAAMAKLADAFEDGS